MESLNMSRLQLTSGTASTAAKETKNINVAKMELNTLTDTEDYFQCVYREDIWKHLLAQEAKKLTIHLQSPQLEFRGTLVWQMRDVTRKLGLSVATLHSAVALLDLFMDGHMLRADRLIHTALACLSLAAKNEEKFTMAPSLRTLSKTAGVQLCGKTFRELECMVGQYVRWRLLSPTAVTFASLLSKHVVSDSDLTSHRPKFVRRFRKDGAKLLESYLDLTLSDVRLKVLESVDVGCACVACARADLGLSAWPASLVALTGRKPTSVAPIARLLHRMMQKLKSNGDQTTDRTPNALLPASSTTGYDATHLPAADIPQPTTDQAVVGRCTDRSAASATHLNDNLSVLDLEDSIPTPTEHVERYYGLPTAVDVACQRINNAAEYRYCMSSRLIETSLGTVQPASGVAVKRGLDVNLELDSKRYRLGHASQTVL